MPAINGQVTIFDYASLAAGTKIGTTYRIELSPESLSGDRTQQVWALISWEGLGVGDLTVNVYNQAATMTPAAKSNQPLLVATSGLQTATSGAMQVFVEVAGPNMYAEAVVNGVGTPDVTVYLLATANIDTVTP